MFLICCSLPDKQPLYLCSLIAFAMCIQQTKSSSVLTNNWLLSLYCDFLSFFFRFILHCFLWWSPEGKAGICQAISTSLVTETTNTDPPTNRRITTHIQTQEGEKDSGPMWILGMEATWPVLLLNQSIQSILDIAAVMHQTNHCTSDLTPGNRKIINHATNCFSKYIYIFPPSKHIWMSIKQN